MPHKTRKYDSVAFQNVLPPKERKFRSAFYYLERLMQIDPEFAERMKEIKKKHTQEKLGDNQSSKEISKAVEQALQK